MKLEVLTSGGVLILAFGACGCGAEAIRESTGRTSNDAGTDVDAGSSVGRSTTDSRSAEGDAASPAIDRASSVDVTSSDGGITGRDGETVTTDEAPIPTPVARQVLAQGNQLRLEALSKDGDWIVYTEHVSGPPNPTPSDCDWWECYTQVNLMAVPSTGGDPTTLATALDLAFARFVGSTLFVMRGNARVPETLGAMLTIAPELLAWQPGDEGLTSLGVNVDPGAFRASPDDRWVSFEANDVRHDNVWTAEIVLVNTRNLTTRSMGTRDHARARFTRDSSWLFFSGIDSDKVPAVVVEGLSLFDDSHYEVAQISDGRWKLSDDGQWLVHSNDANLVRTSITGSEPQLIAEAQISGLDGMQFDVGHNGDNLSFRSEQTGEFGLYSVLLTGGDVTTLEARGVQWLLAHYESVVLYVGASDGALPHLWAVSSTGGTPQDLGPYSYGDAEHHVLDESEDALIVRDALGVTRLLATAADTPVVLTHTGRGAQFLSDWRILFLEDEVTTTPTELEWGAPDGRILLLEGEGTLILSDAEGDNTKLTSHVTGPFEVDPKNGYWYVTTVRDGDATNLVLDAIP